MRFSDDPFDCRGALRSVWSDRDLERGGHAGERAAYRLAVALGRCRMFGVAARDDDSVKLTLPAGTAERAAVELARVLEVCTTEARQLVPNCESVRDPSEADDLCAELLSAHIDARSAFLVIEEELDAAGSASLGAALAEFERTLRRRKERELLCTVVGTRLFENWRSCLPEDVRRRFFWWIDELEEFARRIDEEAARTKPGVLAWDALRRAVASAVGGEPILPSFAFAGVDAVGDAPADDAALDGDVELSPAVLCWVSPDGQNRAELCRADPETPEDGAIAAPLNFSSRRSGRMLKGPGWTGKPVWLAGKPSVIDEHGQAWFTFADLEKVPLRLVVGEFGEVWEYQREGDEP